MLCDQEVLAKSVLSPKQYLERLAAKSDTAAYGAKLLSYQMVQVQCFEDPVGFLRSLDRAGFSLIHLRRQTFAQTLSLSTAHRSNLYHQEKKGKKREALRFEVDDFMRRLEWNELLLKYEERCLQDFPHLRLSYDEELRGPEAQQAAAERVFDWIGVPPSPQPVTTRLKKVLPSKPSDAIANYEEIISAMDRSGLGHLKPE
ncbi:MAG: hypothetical protein AAF384_18885 [Pseudomonadota bacterium]